MSTVRRGQFRTSGVCILVDQNSVSSDGQWLRATREDDLDELMTDASFFAYIASATGAVLENAIDGLRVSSAALDPGLAGGGAERIRLEMGGLPPIDTPVDTDTFWVERGGAQSKMTYLELITGLSMGTDLDSDEQPGWVDITSTTGSPARIQPADGVNSGVLLPADFTKLGSVEAGANNYAHPNHSGDVHSVADGPLTIQPRAVQGSMIGLSQVFLENLAADAQTNLTPDYQPTYVDIQSSTGLPARLELAGAASSTNPGLVEAKDKRKIDSVVNVLQEGADPTGASPSTAAFNNALAAGVDVFVPPGEYLIDGTVSYTAVGQALYGSGADQCRLNVTISDGSPAVEADNLQRVECKDLSIWGANQVVNGQNATGLRFGNATTRWFLQNVQTRYLAKGIELDQAWIGTAVNIWARYCGVGAIFRTCNDTDISYHSENCQQSFVMETCAGLRIDWMHEDGSAAPTSASTIDDCQGVVFSSVYTEYDTVTPSVPEIAIGKTSECVGIIFMGISAQRASANVPHWEIDNANGVYIGPGRFGGGSSGVVYTQTANSRNVTCDLLTADGEYQESLPSPTPLQQPIVNLYPDPLFEAGAPTPVLSNNLSLAVDNTTVPPGVPASLAMTITGAGTSAYWSLNYDLSKQPMAQLKGQNMGLAWYIHAPDTPPFQNVNPKDPRVSLYATVDGTGGGDVPLVSRAYVAGQWVMAWIDLFIPADANLLEIRFYANRNPDPAPGEVVHMAQPTIWIGGAQNNQRFYHGQIAQNVSRVPVVGNSFKANPNSIAETPEDITRGVLPQAVPAVGSRFVGFDPSGNLSEFDPQDVTTSSRKNGFDQVAGAASLNINFDSGNYDNKEIDLDQTAFDVTLTATRSGEYFLRFKQDATGFHNVYCTTTDLQPKIIQLPLNPDSNETTTIRLQYDAGDSSWHWG